MNCEVTLSSFLLLFGLVNTLIDDKYCTCQNIPRTKPTDGRIVNGTRKGTEVLNYLAVLYFRYYDMKSGRFRVGTFEIQL